VDERSDQKTVKVPVAVQIRLLPGQSRTSNWAVVAPLMPRPVGAATMCPELASHPLEMTSDFFWTVNST